MVFFVPWNFQKVLLLQGVFKLYNFGTMRHYGNLKNRGEQIKIFKILNIYKIFKENTAKNLLILN